MPMTDELLRGIRDLGGPVDFTKPHPKMSWQVGFTSNPKLAMVPPHIRQATQAIGEELEKLGIDHCILTFDRAIPR
jgi:hypothetical protein